MCSEQYPSSSPAAELWCRCRYESLNWADPRVALRIRIRGSCPPLWTLQKVTRNSYIHLHVSHPNCPLSISAFSGRIWCLNTPLPSPQRNQFPAMPPMLKSDPSVAPALFFLARAANRHSQNRVSPTISTPPSFPGSLPPPLFLIYNVQESVALFIYSCIYFYLSALPPNQFSHLRSPEHFADNRRMRSRSLNDWEKFATRRRDAWLACFSSHFGAVIWARLRSASAYFNDI